MIKRDFFFFNLHLHLFFFFCFAYLTQGSVPESICNLSALKEFIAHNCHLTGLFVCSLTVYLMNENNFLVSRLCHV